MKRLHIPLAILLFVASASDAQGVFKCTTGSGMTYQMEPCPSGATTLVSVPSSASSASPADAGVAAQPLRRGPSAIHSGSGNLHVGMPDLLVLNNRRWGKPQRITRNRESGAWHERWEYAGGGGKQLHFVNGRLAGVEDLETPTPAESLSVVVAIDDH